MLELDPLHLRRMEVIEMSPQNGEHLSLFMKRLIGRGYLADFKNMTPSALYINLFVRNMPETRNHKK